MSRLYSTHGAHRDPTSRNHFVYRYFDATGALLYVGCSIKPEARFREHRQMRSEMVDRVARIKMQGPYNYQTARQMERDAIRAEDPEFAGDSPRAIRERAERHRAFDDAMQRHMAAGMDVYAAMTAAGKELRSGLAVA